jgi:hypothetical protein
VALEGRGPPDFQDQVIATITWQAAQIPRVGQLLEHLLKQGFIQDIVDVEIANHALANHQEDVVVPIADRFQKDGNLSCLMAPPTKTMVGIHYTDAEWLLIRMLAYNQLLFSDKFDLDRVEQEVLTFFA